MDGSYLPYYSDSGSNFRETGADSSGSTYTISSSIYYFPNANNYRDYYNCVYYKDYD
jgi:hypothetical protein